MRFYFDESGSFHVPSDAQQHSVGIVVGIAVPENEQNSIFERFRQFVSNLPSSAFKDGEPKGRLLSDDARRSFADFICDTNGILISSTILDLTTMAGRAAEIHQKIVVKIQRTAPQCKYETMQHEVALLGRQVSNLSTEQSFRLGTWAHAIKCAIDDSVIWYSAPVFNDCWEQLSFELDPVQNKPNSRESEVFQKILPGWVTGWSAGRPTVLIQEIHTDQHPFVKNWDTDAGINLGKMFRDNIHFRESHKSEGVQIADMAASLIWRAVVGIVSAPDLENYGFMMTKSVRRANDAHGIFSFAESSQDDISRRYYGLVAAVAKAREHLGYQWPGPAVHSRCLQ